jgi:hypothetical protein
VGGGTTGLRVVLGGAAAVHCVHDRRKRTVVTEAQVAELGLEAGQVYDPAQHKLHRCACCENLFVDPTDTPRFCSTCQGPLVHQLGGPLPDPVGVIA